MRTAPLVLLLVACGPPEPVEAAAPPVWRKLTVTGGPAARAGHGMVYDSVRKRVIVFGGIEKANGARTWFDDTWSFDGAAWVKLQPAHHPPARAAFAMAFDAARDRVVVFAGTSEERTLGDTWEFDGSDWRQATPLESPPARWSPAAAWDASRRRMLVFGGWTTQTANDTWEYDGTTWSRLAGAGGPQQASYPIAAFDARAGQVALLSADIVDQQWAPHLWRFTGIVWEEQPQSPMPECPDQTALTSHPVRGLVQYGCIGHTGSTWSFDGEKPSLTTSVVAPPAVNGQALVSDGRRVLLFGGIADDGEERDELWAYE